MVKMLWMINRRKGEPERRKIITRINAYHGVTVATSSMTAKPYNAEFGLPLPGFLHADCPHFWRFGLDGESEEAFTERMARNLRDLIEREGPETIAGMFAEPVQGAGGVIPPSKGYFDAIRPILREYGIPLIADEVICGFGRLGEMWGSDHYDMEPDAIIASKCITAGYYPMGAVILGEKLANDLTEASEAAEEFPTALPQQAARSAARLP
nr:aminotransferase class III-fold pyridoxal phosphate-dependent enzyme [Marinicella sp. W31]MDC2878080.1 aminotransferase class III-fold pyridoxal phosphate-dependent enzyme [Marinicella sp. W31]